MGKKPAAKKKGKAVDIRGFCTTSVPKKVEEEEEVAVQEPAGSETAAPGAEATSAEQAPGPSEGAAAPAGTTEGAEEELEAWERESAQDDTESPGAAQDAAREDQDAAVDDTPLDDEELEQIVEKRLDEELARMGQKVLAENSTSVLDRRGGLQPAGVVVLSKVAEKRVDAALAPLRDEEGILRMVFPKHWRYKGKLTYERVRSMYQDLENMNFKGEHIRWAMSKTVGYDVRAAFEFLLVNLPKEELPRRFGGEGVGEEGEAEELAGVDRPGKVEIRQGPEVVNKEPSSSSPAPAPTEPGTGPSPAQEDAEATEVATKAEEEAPKDAEKSGSDAEDDPGAGVEVPTAEQEAPPAKAEAKPAPARSDDNDMDFNKRWAAQYAHAESDDDDDLLSPEERLERERRADPTARYIKVSKQLEDAAKTTKALKEKKKHGAFKQNVSADMHRQRNATAIYARSKQELEALESGKYGKLDKERIEAHEKSKPRTAPAKAPAPKPEPKAPPPKAPEPAAGDDEGAELPSLFGDGALEDSAATPAPSKPALRTYSLSGWSGKTPKQILEDYVKRRFWSKSPPDKIAKYEAARPYEGRGHWAKVTVQMPRLLRQTFDPEEACATIKEAELLAATFAIMNLCEEADQQGTRRSMAPAFRERWMEWDKEAVDKLREAKRGLIKSRISFVERLLRTKPSAAWGAPGAGTLDGAPGARGRQPGGWAGGDDEADQDFVELSSGAAEKLRADFARRQGALASNETFAEIQKTRQYLPVAEYKEQVLRIVKGSGVTVVSGATGSGKTTQVPQFVLEDALEEGSAEPMPNIIVTEPRRISAVSVARRVSQELGDPAGGPGSRGSVVGYQIRLEKKVSDSTRLLFCTVGVLLKKMQQGPSALNRVSHIFVDEVHERTAECDLLLLLLKQVRLSRPELRIVLMSATMEAEKIVRYFEGKVPVVSIPGRTFPVQAFWLEDAIQKTGYCVEDNDEFAKRGLTSGWQRTKTFEVSGMRGKTQTVTATLDDDEDNWDDEAEMADPEVYGDTTLRTLARMDHSRINYDLLVAVLEYIHLSPEFSDTPPEEGAILVFLPGLGEITKVHERLSRTASLGNPAKCLIISLHSVLSGEELSKAFDKPRRGMRKIVLSTNIAETGVTIPDVVFVVDAGKVKCQRYHEPSNTSSLKEQFVSRAEIMQRRGRAGRVQAGFAFHLVTRSRFELRFQEMPTPEILRCSLMELMLSVLTSGLQPSCFSLALDPPPKSRIDQAVGTLKATGAVEEGIRPANALMWGSFGDEAWYVATPIGLCLARLPCDLRLGKMVLFAAMFGGVEAVWTIAATLSHRTPLTTPFSDSKRAQAKLAHCTEFLPKDGPPSDHHALCTAYVRWDEARKSKGAETFCRKAWLNSQVLQTIKEIRNDLIDTVRSEGYCEQFTKEEVSKQDLQSVAVTSALMFAGLYPNVARLDPPKNSGEKLPALSSGSEALKLHPGSLCHGRLEGLHRTNHRWICYHTKLKTSAVFLRDCTFLTPGALMLFGGETAAINIHPAEKCVSIGVGAERHWHVLHVAPRSAANLRQLRHAFDGLLRRKASDPKRPLSEDDRLVIAAYISILNSVDVEGWS